MYNYMLKVFTVQHIATIVYNTTHYLTALMAMVVPSADHRPALPALSK